MSGRGSHPERWKAVRNFSPCGGSSPRQIARTIATYSRISASGLSIDWPNQCSTTGLCETPRPAIARPPERSSSVAKDWAMLQTVRA